MSGKMLRCTRWGQIPSATGAVGGARGPEPKGKGKSLDYKGGKAHDYKGKGKGYEYKGKGFDIKGKGKSGKGDDQQGREQGLPGRLLELRDECASQRPAYAVEEEIVEEADVGGVWMVGNVEVETANMKLKQAEVPPGPDLAWSQVGRRGKKKMSWPIDAVAEIK